MGDAVGVSEICVCVGVGEGDAAVEGDGVGVGVGEVASFISAYFKSAFETS